MEAINLKLLLRADNDDNAILPLRKFAKLVAQSLMQAAKVNEFANPVSAITQESYPWGCLPETADIARSGGLDITLEQMQASRDRCAVRRGPNMMVATLCWVAASKIDLIRDCVYSTQIVGKSWAFRTSPFKVEVGL